MPWKRIRTQPPRDRPPSDSSLRSELITARICVGASQGGGCYQTWETPQRQVGLRQCANKLPQQRVILGGRPLEAPNRPLKLVLSDPEPCLAPPIVPRGGWSQNSAPNASEPSFVVPRRLR